MPPSPNAAALLKYASVPVNLHSGLVDVSVPLFSVKGRRADIPVSISYHGGGIKVQDVASSVGLGFVLSAGGTISRIIRGLPDEDPQGYLNQDFNTVFNDANSYSSILSGNLDTEPDIFFYNFLGKTGRLVFDHNKVPIQLPEMDLLITPPDFASADPKWQITDKEGVVYTFGKTSASREVTTSILNTTSKVTTCISGWYLSEISYPFSAETVTFGYQQGGTVVYQNYRQYQSANINVLTQCNLGVWPPPATTTPFDIITEISVAGPKYVNLITTVLGTASFTYQNDRQDIGNALRLSEAKLVNTAGTEISKYSFDNNLYFLSDNCTEECKRLKLNSIKEITNGASLNYQTFYYNTTNLPSRKSIKYDHWGYYNNNTYSSAIAPSKTYNDQTGTISYPGADKSPYLTNTQANILRKIENAAGGSQEFFYQLNDYEDGGTKLTGGLRIYQIIEDDGTGVNGTITRTFNYKTHADASKSGGRIYRKYYYDYLTNIKTACPSPGVYNSYSLVMRYSTSMLDFFDIGGSHVGYAEAQINYSNGSKEELYFTNFVDRPDEPATYSIPAGASSPDFTDPDGPPFVSFGDRSYERGLLKEHIFYSQSGKKVKRIVNKYDFYLASAAEAPGGKIMMLYDDNVDWYKKGKYILKNGGVRLLESRSIDYDQSDESKHFAKKVVLTYNNVYSTLIRSEETHLNNGDFLLRQYKYPGDYANYAVATTDVESEAINLLSSKHAIAIVIEDVTSIKRSAWPSYKVIKSDLTTYKKDPSTSIIRPYFDYSFPVNVAVSNFVPSSISSNGVAEYFSRDSRYIEKAQYSIYDTYGNISKYTSQEGITTQIQWVSNSSLVGAITTDPDGAPQTSTYEQLPLIGIASITDPASRKSYYVYDKLNRLKLIKDHYTDIKTRFRYGYKGQSEMATADFTTVGNTATQIVTFSSMLNTETAGTTSYVWDFGDGQVVENAGVQTTHTYASAGTYTTKMAKINAEYGSAITTKSLIIYDPVIVNVSGVPTSFNHCANASATFIGAATGGCGTYTYVWRIKLQGSSTWQVIGSGSSLPFYSGSYSNGMWEVQCEASDSCGHTGIRSYVFQIYCS